jgi:hypothetical protein
MIIWVSVYTLTCFTLIIRELLDFYVGGSWTYGAAVYYYFFIHVISTQDTYFYYLKEMKFTLLG